MVRRTLLSLAEFIGPRARTLALHVILPVPISKLISRYRDLDRNLPPVTTTIILANIIIFYGSSFLDFLLPALDQGWFKTLIVIIKENKNLKWFLLKRYFLLPWYLGIEVQRWYWSMTILMQEGRKLESLIGSVDFAKLTFILHIMCMNIAMLFMKTFPGGLLNRNTYFVGFLGVVFGIRVALEYYCNASIKDTYFDRFLGSLVVSLSRHASEYWFISYVMPNLCVLVDLACQTCVEVTGPPTSKAAVC